MADRFLVSIIPISCLMIERLVAPYDYAAIRIAVDIANKKEWYPPFIKVKVNDSFALDKMISLAILGERKRELDLGCRIFLHCFFCHCAFLARAKLPERYVFCLIFPEDYIRINYTRFI